MVEYMKAQTNNISTKDGVLILQKFLPWREEFLLQHACYPTQMYCHLHQLPKSAHFVECSSGTLGFLWLCATKQHPTIAHPIYSELQQ